MVVAWRIAFDAAVHAGVDVNLTTGLSQAKSASRPQRVRVGQFQQSSPIEQASLYRSSGTPGLQSSVQSRPQPPVTNAWMEKLLRELSVDDEDGDDALPQVTISQPG